MTIQKVTAADDLTICKSHCLSKNTKYNARDKKNKYKKEKRETLEVHGRFLSIKSIAIKSIAITSRVRTFTIFVKPHLCNKLLRPPSPLNTRLPSPHIINLLLQTHPKKSS